MIAINKKIITNILIGTIFAVAILFRFVGLDHLPGINGDEAYTTMKAVSYLRGNSPSWASTSGNLPNYFLIWTMLALNAVFAPSLFLLRLPGFIYGVLAVVTAYFLFKDVIGKRMSVALSLMIACMPMLIGYSRLSWEPALIPLISLICIYFALKEKPFFTVFSLLIGVIIHPTTIFILPFILVVLLYMQSQKESAWIKKIYACRSSFLAFIIFFVCAYFLRNISPHTYNTQEFLNTALANFLDGQKYIIFFQQIINVISGQTLYAYLSGPMSGINYLVHNSLCFYVLLFSACLPLLFLQKKENNIIYAFLIGLVASLLSFYFISGPDSITPCVSRWALWMMAPLCVWFVFQINAMCKIFNKPKLFIPIFIVISILFLCSFYFNFFAQIIKNNSETLYCVGGNGFKTGIIEPKQATFETIDKIRDKNKITVIITEDWWSYWAIEYVASKKQNYIIIRADDTQSKYVRLAENNYQTFRVFWTNSPQTELIDSQKDNKHKIFIKGYDNENIITIFYN